MAPRRLELRMTLPAGLAGFVVLFGLGFLWHVALLGDFYAEQTAAIRLPGLAYPAIVIAELVRGFVLAVMFPIGYQGGSRTGEGLRFGLLIGVFSAMAPLYYLGHFDFTSLRWFWAEGLFFLIQGAVAGMVIGMVYARLGFRRG